MEKLLSYLKETNLTQVQFALLAGVRQATISRIINGGVKDPRISTLYRIEKATRGKVRVSDMYAEITQRAAASEEGSTL